MVRPIHALNMTERITYIRNMHPKSIIIAIDSALTSEDEIGKISINSKSILQGKGVNKKIKVLEILVSKDA